jgi:hypothetical protein
MGYFFLLSPPFAVVRFSSEQAIHFLRFWHGRAYLPGGKIERLNAYPRVRMGDLPPMPPRMIYFPFNQISISKLKFSFIKVDNLGRIGNLEGRQSLPLSFSFDKR